MNEAKDDSMSTQTTQETPMHHISSGPLTCLRCGDPLRRPARRSEDGSIPPTCDACRVLRPFVHWRWVIASCHGATVR
jgi:hypothetical protein